MTEQDPKATTEDVSALFKPFEIKGLTLANRFVMAPMTRQRSPGNAPGEPNVAYYARRAAGGVGLILSEGTVVERPGKLHLRDVPHFYGEQALAGWKQVIDAVHREGGKMAPQLWHVGLAQRNPNGHEQPADLEGPANMSREDVQAAVRAFGEAAADAKRLGFDAVELHGAHGYLIDQFFYEVTNQRTDEYGGKTIGERSRFAVEVLQSVRDAVGPEMVVILRLSQWKIGAYDHKNARTPQEMEQWLLPLSEAGADMFHMSQRHYWEPEFAGSDLNAAGWAKKITGKPTITVGSVGLSNDFIGAFAGEASALRGLGELVRRFERGDFDLVAVGRSLLNDPAWVEKIRTGRTEELKHFTRESIGQYF
ncbi:NADH:flavin oxidoreductase [Sorangium sp. So ce1097]|uniref:NADH:flavin oxidoreductase n=1 Tax=Sorangium sp. So ce1097 TaxID=3133330 RepID=UPI003F5EF37F